MYPRVYILFKMKPFASFICLSKDIGNESNVIGSIYKVIVRLIVLVEAAVRESLRGKDEYFDAGPFATVIGKGIPMARILDQSLFLGSAEFTVSILAEGAGITFKTAKNCLDHLQKLGWISATRKLGNAQAYKFNAENHMSQLIKWATDFQLARNTATRQ